jgi:hypothetical protein
MTTLLDFPFIVSALVFVLLLVSARIGVRSRKRPWKLKEDERDDFNIVLGASLTLLGLIIGFTFSMAVSRYDERKNYEEAEANAIGTEYVRADLLPAADGARVRVLLRDYLDQRILFYQSRDQRHLREINAFTAKLQNELWSVVQAAAAAKPTPVIALTVSGMNDVLNSQGYTQAAWWNRIPLSAWVLMAAIALCCNLLIGYATRQAEAKAIWLLVLPLLVSISFFLIADIDSPRGGIIRVRPENLVSVSQSWQQH